LELFRETKSLAHPQREFVDPVAQALNQAIISRR
jgi:hypothetical protein